MPTCTNCGRAVQPGWSYCHYCRAGQVGQPSYNPVNASTHYPQQIFNQAARDRAMAEQAGAQAARGMAQVGSAAAGLGSSLARNSADIISTAMVTGRGNGAAQASMILGWFAFILCWTGPIGITLGILAIVMGIRALRAARTGRASGGERPAGVGITFGYIGAILGALCSAATVAAYIIGSHVPTQ